MDLVSRIFKKEEKKFKELVSSVDFKLVYRNQWGRIGIELYENWRPCIFIGILAEWEDHAVTPIQNDNSPDFVVLLSFDKDLHRIYPNDNDFIQLSEELSKSLVDNEDQGWQYYNHLKDESVVKKNLWHPLYFRKPMIDVFRGTKGSDDQEKRFMDCAEEILPKILDSNHFKNLRSKFQKSTLSNDFTS